MTSSVVLGMVLEAKDHASGVLKQAEGNVGKSGGVADVAGKALLGIGVATATATAAGVKFAMAAAEEQVGVARLQKAVENTGRAFEGPLADSIEASIAAMERSTAFSDGDMRDSLSLLTALTGDVDEGMKRMQIAMDLARGTGMSLTQASTLLGKVTDENISVLSRYGITVEKGAGATELLGKVQQKFGGQAEAFAKTASGQWEIFQNQMENLQEDIGSVLLPLFTEFGKAAVGAVTELRAALERPEIKAAIRSIAEFVKTAITVFGELFGVISGTAPDAGAKLKEIVGADVAQSIMQGLAMLREGFKTAFGFIVNEVLPRVSGALQFLKENWDVAGPAIAAVALTVIVPAMVAWAAAAAAAAAATIVALAPVLVPLAAIGASVALLALAWRENFLDIQGKTAAAMEFLGAAFEGIKAVISTVWGAIAALLQGGLDAILAPIRTIVEAVRGAMEFIDRLLGRESEVTRVRSAAREADTIRREDRRAIEATRSTAVLVPASQFAGGVVPPGISGAIPMFAEGGRMPWTGFAHLEAGERVLSVRESALLDFARTSAAGTPLEDPGFVGMIGGRA